MPGQLAVGRITHQGGKQIIPKKEGYRTIVVMMKGHSVWWELSPYYLRNRQGVILECAFQFSKAYPSVPAVKERYSRYDARIIWEHPAEVHLVKDQTGTYQPTPEYWAWRNKGFMCQEAVRYPVGRKDRSTCAFAISNSGQRLNYIEARKAIYCAEYGEAVRKEPRYQKLLSMLKKQNLLIVEIDGPHQEDMSHYTEKYGVRPDLIQNDSVDATPEILNIFLNDPKHPFGHGYCLAWILYEDSRKP